MRRNTRNTALGRRISSRGLPLFEALEVRQHLAATPTVDWTAFVGGSGQDNAMDVKLDPAGDIWIAGKTDSSNMPKKQNSYAGDQDGFVTKLWPNGGIAWTRYFGTTGFDEVRALCIDASGSVYIAGTTSGSLSPATSRGGKDAFVAKLNSGGAPEWIRQVGSTGDDYYGGLALDAQGNVLLGVTVGASSMPVAGAANQASGDSDALVVKIDPRGNQVFARYVGGSRYDSANSLAVDTAGHVYLAGDTLSPDLPARTNAIPDAGRSSDVYWAKLSPTGSVVSTAYYGGRGQDIVPRILVQDGDAILLAGATTSPDLPNALNSESGDMDIFLATMDSAGGVQESLYLGSSQSEVLCAFAITERGLLLGFNKFDRATYDSDTHSFTVYGSAACSVLEMAKTGDQSWAKWLVGSGVELGNAAIYDNGQIIVVGQTTSGDLEGSIGTGPTSYNSAAFVSRLVAPAGVEVEDTVVQEDDTGRIDMAWTVTLDQAQLKPVTVSYAVSGITAAPNADFLPASGYLTIPAGMTSGTIRVSVVCDAIPETSEAVQLTLSNPSANAILRQASAVGTITDNDMAPVFVLEMTDYSVVESAGACVVSVLRSGGLSGSTSVQYNTAAISAAPGEDYKVTSGVLTFAPGETRKSISIPVFDDPTVEAEETTSLILSAPTGGGIVGFNSSAIIRILSDDVPDVVPPAATLKAGTIRKRSTKAYAFKVIYFDGVGLNPATLDSRDILVTGPRRYSQRAKLVGATHTAVPGVVVATYSIVAPGRVWDSADKGVYTVKANPGQVYDFAGNALAGRALGNFKVSISGRASKAAASTARTAAAFSTRRITSAAVCSDAGNTLAAVRQASRTCVAAGASGATTPVRPLQEAFDIL